MKKIVILSAFYEPFMSGAEQMAKEIAERLGYNYDITLITARLDKKLPKFENRPTFKLIRVGFGIKIIDKFFYPILSAFKVKKTKPHIVHAVMESYAGVALILMKYLYPRAKRVLTLQCGNLDDIKKQKEFLIRILWKTIHRAPHKITAISNFLARRAIKLGVKSSNVIITPNGVDFSKIAILKKEVNAKKIQNRVICMGRFSWEKGLDFLIKAWPDVLKKIPQAKLILIGEGKEQKNIETLIDKLNISNSIELKGYLPHREFLNEIIKSEIFVCPSLAEGLGNVFIEAQACGVPVIGTNVGGIPDVIQDKENGLLIESKNSGAISKAIIVLLRDKELRDELTERALETVKKFDWNNIIKKIEELYKNL